MTSPEFSGSPPSEESHVTYPGPVVPEQQPTINSAEQAAATPERHQSWIQRLAAVRERPLGRLVTSLAAVLALASGDQVKAQKYEARPHASSVDIVLPDGETTLHFDDWRTAEHVDEKDSAYIEPSPALKRLIGTNASFSELWEMAPAKIENPAAFAKWTAQQVQRPDLRNEIGMSATSIPTPRKWVEMSTAIVVANVDYNKDTRPGHSNYRLPMDQNLREHRRLQCEGYAAANVAVFNELKRQHSNDLNNIYMTTHSGPRGKSHLWNLIIKVTSPTEAQASFIDPAGDDPTYNDASGWDIGPVDVIAGLYDKRLINGATFHALANTYRQTNPRPDEIAELDAAQREVPNDETYDTPLDKDWLKFLD